MSSYLPEKANESLYATWRAVQMKYSLPDWANTKSEGKAAFTAEDRSLSPTVHTEQPIKYVCASLIHY